MNEKVSNLSQTAQEVNPLLKLAYTEFRKSIEERGEMYDAMEEQYGDLESVEEISGKENLVKLANKVIRGEATPKEEVNVKLLLAGVKSNVFAKNKLSGRQTTIVKNFLTKLTKVVKLPESTV
jgi:hypothetical protein